MKDHKFRIFYTILCIAIIIIGTIYYKDATSNNESLNRISYIGTIVTVTAFIIAVFEIIHSIHISKSISEQANFLLAQAITINKASSISDCLSIVDDLNRHVMSENYYASISIFQQLRKLFVKLDVDSTQSDTILNDIELMLHKATKTSINAPLSRQQKNGLMKSILVIKVSLENSNPANGRT